LTITSEDKDNEIQSSDFKSDIMPSLNIIDNESTSIKSSNLTFNYSHSPSPSSSPDDSEQITFINYTHNYCISIIDIVDSTKITDSLPDSEQIRNYYSVFLNTMASIIKQHNGKVIKNAGDCLIYYFPKTVNSVKSNIISTDNDNGVNNNFSSNKYSMNKNDNSNSTYTDGIVISNESALQDVIECGLAMIKSNSALNSKLYENGLPTISYRISANYGRVELATSTNSYNVDLFGPTVNICSKINHLALPNQMVIYKDLYDVLEVTSFFKEYKFNKIKSNTYFTCAYPVYSVDYAETAKVEYHDYKDYGNNKSNMYFENKQKQKFYSEKKTKTTAAVTAEELQEETYAYENRKEMQKGNSTDAPLKSSNRKQSKTSNSSYNILLIDDDEDILFTFTSIIQNEGFKTTSISNPIKALNYFSQIDPYHYDLIVMDIRMPGLNGIQLYFKLKVMNPDIKVLFLSALDAVEELLSIFPEVKSSEIIRKPIESKDLILKINTILKSQ
jgi:CheY-like chemotaxis protein